MSRVCVRNNILNAIQYDWWPKPYPTDAPDWLLKLYENGSVYPCAIGNRKGWYIAVKGYVETTILRVGDWIVWGEGAPPAVSAEETYGRYYAEVPA